VVPAGGHHPGDRRLALLTTIGAHTSLGLISIYIFVFEPAWASSMQVLTLVVQNSVPMAQLGVATSS